MPKSKIYQNDSVKFKEDIKIQLKSKIKTTTVRIKNLYEQDLKGIIKHNVGQCKNL